MSLLRQINGIDLYVVPNQHWIVSAIYPDYQDMEKFFDFSDSDISAGTCKVSGIQRPIEDDEWIEERNKYKEWLLDIFSQIKLPISKITERNSQAQEYRAWTINYFPGGWQAGHFHSTDKIQQSNERFASSVMMFDYIKPSKKNRFNGCLYTTLQDPNGYTYDHKFHPEPGRVVVMDDRVWHGTYPTEENRRSLVWDFDIN